MILLLLSIPASRNETALPDIPKENKKEPDENPYLIPMGEIQHLNQSSIREHQRHEKRLSEVKRLLSTDIVENNHSNNENQAELDKINKEEHYMPLT